MKVSVIIPMLNEETEIAEAVRSAREAGAAEVIACDGGSEDGSVDAATRAGAIVVQSGRGRGRQCNAGAAQAAGIVLLFLHADCRLHPQSIRALTDCTARRDDVVAGGYRQRIADDGRVYRLLESGNLLRGRLLHWVYGDQGLFVRADLFRKLGGFPDVAFMEDFLFSRTVARKGRIVMLDPPIVVSPRRWHRRGPVRQTLRNWGLITCALCGVSPNRLARHYPNDR